jgi:hypothetical protein
MQMNRSAFERVLLQELGELCELGVKCLISNSVIGSWLLGGGC